MKKLSLLLAATSLVSAGVFAQVQRQSLLEVFTSSTCGPCTAGNAQMEGVLPTIENYTVVKYQQNFPGAGDPYQTAESIARRDPYYAINSIPRMEVDGQWDKNAQSFTKSIFDSYVAVPASLDFKFNTYSYDPATKDVVVDVDINPYADIPTTTLRLMVAIVEKHTVGNVASNGETDFYNVFMSFIPSGNNGTPVAALTNGVKVNNMLTFNMTSTFIEEITDLRAVVWVEDYATKTVLNSAWIDLRDVIFNGVEEIKSLSDVSVFPNPFTSTANVNFQLKESANIKIQVLDIMGKVVTTYNKTTYPAGYNNITIDGSNMTNGIYYVNMISDEGTTTRRLVLNK